ncbi:hypothetical protein [Streptomyces sp. NPDC056069]|uniref:peptidoglycan recognition protein family protein n=1 Tax=Streptomyces sp. NPDC056069 TaxID=3345702 RepID=UPI0035E281F9
MAIFVTRAQWGASTPKLVNHNITPANGGVTIHHTGGSKVARSNHADCDNSVRNIQNQHMNVNGWADIAYSHIVCSHGYVFQGRGEHVRSAANGSTSGNQNWYAVLGLVGGAPANYDTITDGLLDAFRYAINRLRVQGGAANAINCHKDHVGTLCPGNLEPYVRWGDLEP